MNILSTIKTSCRDCYKCVRHCPVKAIRFSMGHAEIIDERCIKDGRCVLVCPQHAKVIRNDVEVVKNYFENKEFVIASLAPSFVPTFPDIMPGQLFNALKALGFTVVRETAEAAELVALEHARLVKEGNKAIITSSCPAINALIYKYYPQHISYLAPIVSPMVAHARLLKKEFEGQHPRVVFIGPCIAKKAEREESEIIDEVDVALTFDELKEWLIQENIDINQFPIESEDLSSVQWARAFPVEGGLLKTGEFDTGILSQESVVITGIERCQRFLDDFEKEKEGLKMVEMMSCEGGCIDGPLLKSPLSLYQRRKKIIEFSQQGTNSGKAKKTLEIPSLRREFNPHPILQPQPTEEELRKILTLTGKFTPQDELNCGACGYDTCREKAVAVYQGLAEAEMCIPYMRARAESFSSFLIAVTPNGIILVDENLRIVDMNPALRQIFDLKGRLMVGKTLDEFIDPSFFVEVLRTKKAISQEIHYPQHNNVYVKLSVFYLEKSGLLMGVFVDLTKQKDQEQMMEEIRGKTLEKAQQVITNQMLVAQEIASLLGETTAETKSLLSKLMKILRGENVEE
ncbi:[Fe-Fe] hydrogenase large subunit C-terminal domain-containing protein [Atribacter laminatus]|uniref:Iron hydrogenase 1 n=1 Tax=Atribacter laminatus TaxID=2847778 RepID=A0A7T1AM10_ATRLM|nr:[Fe-Fe] hydrogenase large subunit C-terminal domain-containing protein [Atribacter laminatus]QPM68368.1 Iron hydrogenase 1 [Atribacter laminatus]